MDKSRSRVVEFDYDSDKVIEKLNNQMKEKNEQAKKKALELLNKKKQG